MCFLCIFQNESFDLKPDRQSEKEIASEWVRLRCVFIGSTHEKPDFVSGPFSWNAVRDVTKDKSVLRSMGSDGKIAAVGVLLDSVELLNRFVVFLNSLKMSNFLEFFSELQFVHLIEFLS